jgi:hypothetical protein
MKFVGRLVSFLVAVVVVGACASTKVSEREILVTEKVPRPDHILIYDFAATPADVPANSPLAAAATAQTPQTPEQIETGRRVGAEIATQLAERVRRMGLPAERALRQSAPQINDIVIRDYLVSVSEGSAAQRPADGAVVVGALLAGQAGEVTADEDLLQDLGRYRGRGGGRDHRGELLRVRGVHGLILHRQHVVEAGVDGGEHQLAEAVVELAAINRALAIQEKAHQGVEGVRFGVGLGRDPAIDDGQDIAGVDAL